MNLMMLSGNEVLGVDKTEPIEGFLDKLKFGGTMLLIGMVAIFSVLFVIWLCMTLFFRDTSGKKVKTEETVATPTPVIDTSADIASDEEIVAVISAAVAMAESENKDTKFRVVSFRRT